MMKLLLLLSLSLFTMSTLWAQDTPLPLREIPAAPETYSSGSVLARMIEGLGYRYYWATEGLREEDLSYKISDDSRSSGETLDHLLGLSVTIYCSAKDIPREFEDMGELSFEQKRRMTLENLAQAAALLRDKTEAEVAELSIVFQRGENQSEYPYWNMINGPIADAIYHTGQIVSYRRASGNPINPGVNVFMGKTRE
ncbi:MAG: hypothetical protein AAF927_16695 [Bacteroidota bacterium]